MDKFTFQAEDVEFEDDVAESGLTEYNPYHGKDGKFAHAPTGGATPAAPWGGFTPADYHDAEAATRPPALPWWSAVTRARGNEMVPAVKGAPYMMSDYGVGHAFVDAYQRWAGRLTPTEIDAVRDYTSSGFDKMNSALRHRTVTEGMIHKYGGQPRDHLDDWRSKANLARGIGSIDSALDKAPSLPAMTVFRGVGTKLHATVGKPFEWRGFTSCSTTPSSTPEHAQTIRIKVPAGKHGMWLGDAGQRNNNEDGDGGETIGLWGEGEFLLKRGTKFKWGKDDFGDYLEVVN